MAPTTTDQRRDRPNTRSPRTEMDVVAEVVAHLLMEQVISHPRGRDQALANACAVVGVPPKAVREAWVLLDTRRGYLPPQGAVVPGGDKVKPLKATNGAVPATYGPGNPPPAADAPRSGRLPKRRGRSTNTAQRNRNPDGTRNCTCCGDPKPLTEFRLKDRNRGHYSSRCSTCLNRAARTRYLSVGKVDALDRARIEFTLVAEDGEVVAAKVGLCCSVCRKPFEADQTVCGDVELRHSKEADCA